MKPNSIKNNELLETFVFETLWGLRNETLLQDNGIPFRSKLETLLTQYELPKIAELESKLSEYREVLKKIVSWYECSDRNSFFMDSIKQLLKLEESGK